MRACDVRYHNTLVRPLLYMGCAIACSHKHGLWCLSTDLRGTEAESNLACASSGCNSFRLSLEWSRMYPERGELDQSAVQRYHDIFDTLERCACLYRPLQTNLSCPVALQSRRSVRPPQEAIWAEWRQTCAKFVQAAA